MGEQDWNRYVMDCLRAGKVRALSVGAHEGVEYVSVEIEIPLAEKMFRAGGEPDYHPHVNCPCVMPEPHTCPICDGYGYLVRVVHQGYINHHKVDAFREVEELYDASEMVPRLGDIPCPDCEAEVCSNCHPDNPGYVKGAKDGWVYWYPCGECSEPEET